MDKKERTSAQSARQANRRNGKYANMNRCELCGKHLGEDYRSDLRVNSPEWGTHGLVLCGKCCVKLNGMPDHEALELLKARE